MRGCGRRLFSERALLRTLVDRLATLIGVVGCRFGACCGLGSHPVPVHLRGLAHDVICSRINFISPLTLLSFLHHLLGTPVEVAPASFKGFSGSLLNRLTVELALRLTGIRLVSESLIGGLGLVVSNLLSS